MSEIADAVQTAFITCSVPYCPCLLRQFVALWQFNYLFRSERVYLASVLRSPGQMRFLNVLLGSDNPYICIQNSNAAVGMISCSSRSGAGVNVHPR